MKAFAFQGQVGPDNTVALPAEIAAQLTPRQEIRVLLLVAEDREDADWARASAEQFFKDDDDADAIYDKLRPG